MTDDEYVVKLRYIIWSACGAVGLANLIVTCLLVLSVWISLSNEIAKVKSNVEASGNNLTIHNEQVSDFVKEQARQILIKEGSIHGRLPDSPSPKGPASRSDKQ